MKEIKNTKKRKVLVLSPMLDNSPFLPLNISLIIAILVKGGYQVKLFDTTFYKIPLSSSYKALAERIGTFKPVNWNEHGISDLKEGHINDFKDLIGDFKPEFILISIFTTFNAKLAMSFIDAVGDNYSGKVIVGGIHALVAIDELKKNKKISAIVSGECEDMLLKALDFLGKGKTGKTPVIPNLNYRDHDGAWVDAPSSVITDIEKVPFLNWDHFDERNFYRPFHGRLLRMGHVEIGRGCCYRCPYCINERFHEEFGNFWRLKSADRFLEEVSFLKKKYDLSSLKIWDDNLLAMDISKVGRIACGLKKIGIKFLCHSRPEHMSKEKVRLLAKNGCIQIGIGVESGNPDYRRKMLRRYMTNRQIIDAFKYCRMYKISSTAFCMLGMPEENESDIMLTARLLRRADPDVISHAIFTPYPGNSLYEYARRKGYIDKNIDYQNYTRCFLKMPSIKASKVEALFKTFIFYCRFRDRVYPLIKKAANDSKIFAGLKVKLEGAGS